MGNCSCKGKCANTGMNYCNLSESLIGIFSKYPSKDQEYLIPLLQDIQEKFGYLSKENILNVAGYLDIPSSKVYGVATFYNQFRLDPLGKYTIKVCRGTACHVKGSNKLLETLEEELNVKQGETTADGLFTLETVACIGACSIAPVIVIDEEFHGRLTLKELKSALKKYKE